MDQFISIYKCISAFLMAYACEFLTFENSCAIPWFIDELNTPFDGMILFVFVESYSFITGGRESSL